MGINRKNLSESLLMPFGVHKDRRIEDVPDSYLNWLSEQDWLNKWPEVEQYIKANFVGIKKRAREEEQERTEHFGDEIELNDD